MQIPVETDGTLRRIAEILYISVLVSEARLFIVSFLGQSYAGSNQVVAEAECISDAGPRPRMAVTSVQ